jgi:uncharacterized protein (UPF0261 family)
VEGGALFDPPSDEIFISELKGNLNPEIRISEVSADINSREFAQAVVEALRESLRVKA